MTVVIGTAGHIDHGKTTLLRALTGIDADRLPEERRRGMTIDVGYAHLALDDGTELDFVDVPGHDRLIGNMLVGAGEIDAAMLVVAADDGPRAQTLEHLELLDALGDRRRARGRDEGRRGRRRSRGREVVAAVRALARPDDAPRRAGRRRVRRHRRGARRAPGGARRASRRGRSAAPASAPTRPAAARDRPRRSRPRPRHRRDRQLRGGAIDARRRGCASCPAARTRPRPRASRSTAATSPVPRAAGPRSTSPASRPAPIERGAVLTADPAVIATDRILVALRPATSLATAAPRRPETLPRGRARVPVHAGTARVEATVGRSGRDARRRCRTARSPRSSASRRRSRSRPATGSSSAGRRPAATLAGGRVLDADPPRGASRRRDDPGPARGAGDRRAGLGDAWAAARLELHGAVAGPAPRSRPDVAAVARRRGSWRRSRRQATARSRGRRCGRTSPASCGTT